MSSIGTSEIITICYRPEDNIPVHQLAGNLESSQNRIDNKDIASASREKKQLQLSNPMQKQMPCTPAQTPNEVNSYKTDNNTEGDTQEDTEMYANYLKSLEGRSETKTVSPEPMESHGEAKTDSPQPKEVYIKGLLVPPENSLANPTNFLGDIPPPTTALTISDATISDGQLKYLLSWLPTCYMIEDLKRLRNPGYRSVVSTYGPIAVVCWYPTWVSPAGIPHKRLVSYYTENPRHLHRHARIHKPLNDVMIEIARRGKPYEQRDQPGEAPDGHSEDLSRRGTRKRKVDCTVDGASKKPKK